MEEHPQARLIVETLSKAGFVAYYAGGWVRDYLLQHPSDDIDIATNAPPETIQALFPHTVPIGIAFGIILVIIEGHPYEVATFRQDLDYKDGRRPSKIAYATAEEDAKRRDFTINGLFYNPLTQEIHDFVGGRADLQLGIIRAIGNPDARIREDRLRMVRAVRLACRFGFAIENNTIQAIKKEAHHLRPAVAIERICQEFVKALNFGKLDSMLIQMHAFGLLLPLFPTLAQVTKEEIEQRLAPLKHYPQDAPLIAYLLPLFPNASTEEQSILCKMLKRSNQEEKFALYLAHGKRLCANKESSRYEWAHFYAHPSTSLALHILSAHENNPQCFLTTHQKRIAQLQTAITRIQTSTPLISSQRLLQEGITPGKTMGRLLAAAERIAIDENFDDPTLVIAQLKRSSLWP